MIGEPLNFPTYSFLPASFRHLVCYRCHDPRIIDAKDPIFQHPLAMVFFQHPVGNPIDMGVVTSP